MVENEQFSGKNDIELVEMSLKDQDNFLYLIERYEAKLLRYIRRITNIAKEDAEDLLQEVFLKVYLKLNDFDRDLKFSSWIYRITHNEVISNHRKLKARPQSVFLNPENDLINNLVADLDLEKSIEMSLLRDNIFKILDHLEIKYKEILILKFLEDKNYREISDILKIPMGTVGTLINKGKEKFKEELARQKIKL